jgi:hypothetical protein
MFKSHMLNEAGKIKAREVGDAFEQLLTELSARGVDGRELAIVKTKLEEACFFAKRSIATKPENQQT